MFKPLKNFKRRVGKKIRVVQHDLKLADFSISRFAEQDF